MYYGYFDASVNEALEKTGIGAYIVDKSNNILWETSESIDCVKTSHSAEYLALIRLLEEAVEMELPQITVYGDCSTVIKQVSKNTRSSSLELVMLKKEVQRLLPYIATTFVRIPRTKNRYADKLSCDASEKND